MQKSIKGVLNCCKLRVVFKSQNKLCNNFRFKDPVPQILTSGVVYEFQSGLCNKSYYGKCVRYLAVRSGEDIGISPLNSKRVQPGKDSVVCYRLLNCNYSPTFADFSVPCHPTLENWKKAFLWWIRELKRMFCPSLSVWMSSCHIVRSALWTSVISF